MVLEAEAGLKWRVWEENLPQLMFSGALGSLSCLWVLCGDILWLRDTGKGQDQGPDQTNQAPPSCHQGAAVGVLLRKLLFRKGKTPPVLPPLSQKGWKSLLSFCPFPGSGRPNGYLGKIPCITPPPSTELPKSQLGLDTLGVSVGPHPAGQARSGVWEHSLCGGAFPVPSKPQTVQGGLIEQREGGSSFPAEPNTSTCSQTRWCCTDLRNP